MDVAEGIDMLCSKCGYYCGSDDIEEAEGRRELDAFELEADFEAEAELEGNWY